MKTISDRYMRKPINFQRCLAYLLKSSNLQQSDMGTLSLPLIREIIYRIFSLTTPLSVFPSVLVSWQHQQTIFLFALGMLEIVVALHAVLLFSRNYRVLSPVMMFSISFALYIVAVFREGAMVLYWAAAFTLGFYLLLEKHLARYMNVLWTILNAILAILVLPREMLAFFIGGLASTGFMIEILFRILNRHEDQLKKLAVRDPLTNAFNRRTMMEDLQNAIAMGKRYRISTSLVMIDVDHFKSINDNFGHQEGDDVLIKLVDMLSARLRCTDKLYRYGGEEFVAVLTSTALDQAVTVAGCFCEAIRGARISEKAPITISCGVAELRGGETLKDWLARCDMALYQAKADGRDRVVMENSHNPAHAMGSR